MEEILQRKFKRWSHYLIYLVLFLSLTVLIGWQFDIYFLLHPIPQLAAMNPTTAVLFIFSGVAFLLFSSVLKRNKSVSFALIFLVFLVAFVKLLSIFTKYDPGIDQLLFREKILQDIAYNTPNRMAPNTAFSFLLISLSTILLQENIIRKKLPAQLIALAAASLAVLSIIGYVYHVQAFYGILSYIPMAIHTAIGFLLFAFAILFYAPGQGLMKDLTSAHSGSHTARILIPPAILIPILLGYMRLLEYWFSSTSTEFSIALLMLGIIVVFVFLIWYNAGSLNKKDILRKEAEEKLAIVNRKLESMVAERTEKLQTKEMEYSSVVEQANDGVFISDNKGNYTEVNASACRMLGYTREELLKMNSSDILLQEDALKNPPRLKELSAGKSILSTRILLRKDGTTLPAEISGKMLSNGKMLGIVRDITERKKAEEKLASSELLFRQTLDNMLEGVQIHDFEWKYTYVNDSLVKYSHYQKEELLDCTLMEKYPGIEQTELFGVLKECMFEKVTKHFETEFIFPNGAKAFFELSVQPIPTGLFILSIDITERKKAEEKNQKLNEELEQKVVERTLQLEENVRQLSESEEKFQKAFRASAAGMTITKLSDSCYMEVNDAFLAMTGYHREEVIGRSSAELGIVKDIKKREVVLSNIREQGWAKQFEMTVHRKSGELVEVLASVETILLNGEKFALNIIFDITDRKRAEQQLKEANKELEAFSYSISHDLRAPLRAIDGYAKMLEEDYGKVFDQEGKRLLEVIQRNVHRMGNLIDDLLEFSRLGRKAIQKTTLNMNSLVAGILGDLQKNIPAKTEIKVSQLHTSQGDYTLISQVMVNLLSNAIKYSSKKEQPIVEIFSEEKNGAVLYTVKDNGAGFDMRYANKLFGVFQRLHSSKEFEGTGVGLAIVHRIIDRHGGKIWAESELDHGASFYFLLPLS